MTGGGAAWRGWSRHVLLTLELNFRNWQGTVYGYLVPVLFLLAFGGVFRTDEPPLLGRMGQILTITILGGACFGLPTGIVAERELGVWRRYRMLPVRTHWLVLGSMLARMAIVASAALLQLALARAIFGTPLPEHPGSAAAAFVLVTASFLGLGFLVAGLASTVPAVQAVGQCLFLPMMLIGGVGVPLSALPPWAQRLAGFLPGRYAVEALQPCFAGEEGLRGSGFRLAALAVIGIAAGTAGARLFRWEAGGRRKGKKRWLAVALASWVAVGATAWRTGQLPVVLPEAAAWQSLTEAEIAEIGFEDLPRDNDIVAGLAPRGVSTAEGRAFARKLAEWEKGRLEDHGQSIRNLVAVAALADLCADPREAEMARAVLERIGSGFAPAEARQALAWIVLAPDDGTVVRKAAELGLPRHPPERLVRQRSSIYARKFLGRLTGRIRE